MEILKVSLKSKQRPDSCYYHNQVNPNDFKSIALFLLDLDHFGKPIEKAVKEYLRLKKSDWETAVGI